MLENVASKMLKNQESFHWKITFMATFNESRVVPSQKCSAEQGTNIQQLSETLRLPWSHSSVFDLEEKPQHCYIFSFFNS